MQLVNFRIKKRLGCLSNTSNYGENINKRVTPPGGAQTEFDIFSAELNPNKAFPSPGPHNPQILHQKEATYMATNAELDQWLETLRNGGTLGEPDVKLLCDKVRCCCCVCGVFVWRRWVPPIC